MAVSRTCRLCSDDSLVSEGLAVGLAALGTLPEWTIDGTVEDVYTDSRLQPTLSRFTESLCYVRAVVRDILNLASFRTF